MPRPRSLWVGLCLAVSVAVVTLPPATASAAGTDPAARPGVIAVAAADAVPDSYLVVLRDQVAPTLDVAALAARYGGHVQQVYRVALRGFAVRMSAAQAARLAADPAVASVEQNARIRRGADAVSATGVQPNPPSWALDRIDQRTLPLDGQYAYPNPASNVNAYVIDTGININHVDFGGRAHHGWDFVDDDAVADDCNGHGTHVAGLLGGGSYGAAKGIQLYAVRVLDCAGSGTIADVVAGVEWVTTHHVKPAVANMSLGGGASTALDQAVRGSIAAGVTYTVAAGGSASSACDSSPSRVAEAITVGGTTMADARASFSNYGSCVDIFAPAVTITSTWIGSRTATNTLSGNSMAAPLVAGGAAMYLADNPTATPAAVTAALAARATTGVLTGVGAGSPNRLLHVGP